MEKSFDAIIIGAGVIGSAIGFELSKKGYKTLNLDSNPTSGYGSTAASCASLITTPVAVTDMPSLVPAVIVISAVSK